MAWVPTRQSAISDTAVRDTFASLQKFLANPTFPAGMALGSGAVTGGDPANGVPDQDVTSPVTSTTLVAGAVPDDGVAPAAVAAVSLTPTIQGFLAKWATNTEADVINGFGTYEVQVANDAAFTVGAFLSLVSGNAWGYHSSTLIGANLRYVRVRAIDARGNVGAWSATAAVTTLLVTGPDIAANVVTANKIAANTITSAELAAINMTVGQYFRSTNYNGTSYAANNATQGFNLEAAGNFEAQNVRLRGAVLADTLETTATATNGKVKIDSVANAGKISMWGIGANSTTEAAGADLTATTSGAFRSLVAKAGGGDTAGGATLSLSNSTSGQAFLNSASDVILTANRVTFSKTGAAGYSVAPNQMPTEIFQRTTVAAVLTATWGDIFTTNSIYAKDGSLGGFVNPVGAVSSYIPKIAGLWHVTWTFTQDAGGTNNHLIEVGYIHVGFRVTKMTTTPAGAGLQATTLTASDYLTFNGTTDSFIPSIRYNSGTTRNITLNRLVFRLMNTA